MLKRFVTISLITTLLLATLAFSAEATPQEPAPSEPTLETTATSAILMDHASGQVMFSKNVDEQLPMASVTKLMTMLLACEAEAKGLVQGSSTITTSERAASMGGSQVFLEPGEEMTFKEMMISIATGSANDASVAVAEHIGGSEEAFIHRMNERAKELGMTNTHFANTTGLPIENHYTSAKDMAVVLKEALKYPLFKEISAIYEYDLRGGDFKLWNTNKLLKWYQGCDAGKTGWTNEAQYCLAASAERDDLRLISVVLATPEPKSHFRETMKLFNYGFARYQSVVLAKAGQKVQTVPVDKGTIPQVNAITAGQVAAVVPRGEDKGVTGEIDLPIHITAPVKKGQKMGTYRVIKDKKILTEVAVISNTDIAKASPIQLTGKVLHQVFGME